VPCSTIPKIAARHLSKVADFRHDSGGAKSFNFCTIATVRKGSIPAGQAADKIMRLHAQTALIENGFVRLPGEARWLADAISELTASSRGPP